MMGRRVGRIRLPGVLAAAALTFGASVLEGQPNDSLTSSYEVSGVRVVHRVNRANDVVAVRLYLLGGSQQLVDHPEGIEALLLRSIQMETGGALERSGGRPFFEVDRDWSVTGFLTLREYLAEAWPVWAEGITTATLSGPAVTRARASLLSDARQRYSESESRVHWLAWQSIFRDHPYRFDPWGTISSLEGMGAQAVRDYHSEQVSTSRMLLVIVGNVSREEVVELVAGTLGRLPEGSYAWSPPPEVERLPNQWRTENRDLPTNYIQGIILGPRPGEDDYFAFEVATNLLSGKLHSTLRDKLSLSYAAYATFDGSAIPTAGIYASSTSPTAVYRVVIEELEWVQTLTRVPGWILNRYLEGFYLDQLAQNVTADGQAEALGRAEILFGDHRQADAYLEGIQDVRPHDIRRVAIEYMRDIQMAYLGNLRLMSTNW